MKCFWTIYQANPTYENMCHFLKHRAYCRMVRANWLTRPMPESFFAEAGRHGADEFDDLFSEIPDTFKQLAHAIITLSTESTPEMKRCREFRQLLFILCDDLKKENIDLKLPYFWYADGVMIPPEYIVRITNGIVGWVCDDSAKGCLMEGECRYFKAVA
ncbi:hypothetical protein M0R72_19295 [Candidatus Pacearchaeota archaeon]|nr:hypothetical protein [Candidatus Pacearchaeota archaeon]